MGGILFIVKFNGACLRPPVPRPLTKNKGMQVKFVDDASQIASVNLKKSLVLENRNREKPLNYHERTEMILKPEENILQQELDKFYQFTENNKLVINKKKCFVMQFSRSKNYDFPPEFRIGGSEILQVRKEQRILGVIVQDSLKWDSQCQEMIRKATNTTWAIRRMKTLGVPEATLLDFWKSEGRVHLEYACPVWHSSLTVSQARSLDRAQRVAMATITGRWEASHTLQLQQLDLEKLGPRRERICRLFASRTATNSRHQDLFSPLTSVTRRGVSGLFYHEITTRTSTYHNSALPYLTRLLNQR